jgi:hypothetical protein
MWNNRFRGASKDFYRLILDLPPAAKFVLYILDVKKTLNRKEIQQETLLPKRTVGGALKLLLKSKLIKKIQGEHLKNLDRFYRKKIDYRTVFYQIDMN